MKIKDVEKAFSGRPPGVIGKHSSYSVLVPLVEKDGELNLLFEVRSFGLKRQPGEVCFPGGKIEAGETEEECAVRETVEELGVRRESIRIISQLDSVHTYSNSTLYSFLGEIEHDELLHEKINRREVESVFYLPLAELVENEPFIYKMEVLPDVREDFPYDMINFSDGYNWRKGITEVPIYKIKGKIIWGLTARISHNFVNILREAHIVQIESQPR
ncbi:MAG: CoA pyrophosphatase [Clostridiales bacterium]|nr:CoA pyrophosphatase [Clostridiales bacterium]